MIYLYIVIAFVILAAAGFGASYFLRWLRAEFDRLESVIHARIDGVMTRVENAETCAMNDASAVNLLVRKTYVDLQTKVHGVEQLFKQHALAVQEDTNKLVAQARQIHDNAIVGAGRLAKRVERL